MYFITFTRKMGTGGSEIAKGVAAQLGYGFYDTEAIEAAAQEMGFLDDVRDVDEKVPSLFARFFSHRPEIHLDRLNSVIYELATKGNAVFLGRGSHVLLKASNCALHVRVTASLKKRLQNLMARGLENDAALKAIHRSDQEREAFTRFAFGVDWENPELYDIVLNMDNLTVDLAVQAVSFIARTEEVKVRSTDAMSSLAMLALEKRAEAALIEAGFSMTRLTLSVTEPGRINLTGVANGQAEAERAADVVRKIKGVESVDNQIRIVPSYYAERTYSI